MAHRASAQANTLYGYLLAVYDNEGSIGVWSIGSNRELIKINGQRGVESLTFDAQKGSLGWISDSGIMVWRFSTIAFKPS